MGKKVQHRATGISIERNHSGCIWGIVHSIQHQHWHHVRKRMLPHRRHRGSEIPGNDINATDDGPLQDKSNAKMESPLIEEQKGLSQSRKGSVKSRIKAFISNEMSKRRDKHRRSTSYPTRMQLMRTDSIHHLQDSDFHHFNKAPIEASSNFFHHENECFFPLNSIEKQGNALNMNRELPLKALLEKTNSSRGNFKEIGYGKSMSFPRPGSSRKGRRKFGSMEDKSELLMEYVIKPEPWDNSSIDLQSGMKKDVENKIPRKHFKNLKERIKHAIRESKKERHRIMMDAVFHKVPCGQKLSQYEREGIADLRKDKGKGRCRSFKPPQRSRFDESLDRYRQLYFSCFNNEAKHHIVERLKLRRDDETPLLSETNPKKIGRMFSLPDLRVYYLLQSGDFPGCTSKTPNKSDIMKEKGKIICGFNEMEPKDLSVASENEILFHALVKCGNENRAAELGDSITVLENEVGSTSFVDFKVESLEGLGLDDLESLTTAHEHDDRNESSSVSLLDSTTKKTATSNSLLSEDSGTKQWYFDEERPSQSFPDQKSEMNIDSPSAIEKKPNIEEIETSVDQLHTELLRVPVNSEDVPKFNFVKYVLELSGFSKNESLGAWNSPQQPLDPLMFDEFYDEDQQDENRDNLLLFDLVNEVLLDIYGKSFTYCPIRLCAISYTRPVPAGYRVLEEVWAKISWHLAWKPEADQLLDEAMSRDLTKSDDWMNLHYEAECVGLELEDMIFEDLLEELILALTLFHTISSSI